MLSIEQIIIITLSIFCIILLICIIFNKDKKANEPKGDVGNWSDKQKAVLYDKVLYAIMLEEFDLKGYVANMCGYKILDMMHCIVDSIANKYTYKYANLNFITIVKDNDVMGKMKADCSTICLGKKGNWSENVKQAVFSKFVEMNLPQPHNLGDQCVSCIVDQLQNNYGPLDDPIINFIKYGRGLDYSKELGLCKYTNKCV